jgi:hypothetical protein
MRGVYCESLASAPVVAVANIQNPIWVCIEDNYFGPPFATLVHTASPLCQYWRVRNNGPYLAVTDNGNLNYVEQVGSATYSGQSVANWMGATFGDPAIGIFTDIGTSPTTGGSGIALKNNYGSVTSATRNFALATVVAAYGDFAIRQSAAAGGNPFTSGQNLAYWDAGGNVTFPHGATIQGTDPAITLTNATATATTSAVVSATVPIKIGSTTYKMMLST